MDYEEFQMRSVGKTLELADLFDKTHPAVIINSCAQYIKANIYAQKIKNKDKVSQLRSVAELFTMLADKLEKDNAKSRKPKK
jgi:hypothetical protein